MKAWSIAAKINALTGLCALVALTCAAVLWFRMQTEIDRRQQALATFMQQADKAREIQVNFKKQVQEWKNILLRGHDAKDFEKYHALFVKQESLVREDARALTQLLTEPTARTMLAAFLSAHEELGQGYQRALDFFVRSGRSDSRSADRIVRGADRPPTDLLDQLVASIASEVDQYTHARAAALAEERYYAALAILGTFLLLMGMSVLIGRHITTPIRHLADTATRVTAEKDYSLRAAHRSDDELGVLAHGFNVMLGEIQAQDRMLHGAHDKLERQVANRTRHLQKEIAERVQAQEELERLHKQLLEASRQAGMAEVASSVLHNVGNVLNSVNVSANLLADHIEQSKASDLARVVTLLREHEHELGTFVANDPKGKHLPVFLANLSKHLHAEHEAAVKELKALQANSEHIKEVVTMQQSYAKISGVTEIVRVVDLVEDSLRLNAGALSRHDVEVVREFEADPIVNVEKHKVLQILVNLVRNAKYACEESGRSDRRLTLRVANGDGLVRISVIDNGVGIPPENLTRIFSHGFTTRLSGHGFGLHSGALAAQELGGALRAESEGMGRGAAFTLEFPLQPSASRDCGAAEPIVRSA